MSLLPFARSLGKKQKQCDCEACSRVTGSHCVRLRAVERTRSPGTQPLRPRPLDGLLGFPRGPSGKEPTCQGRRCKRHGGFDPWSGRSSVGNSTPLQYSCLENPMDRGAWRATVHGVAKSWTRLSTRACTHTHTHTLNGLSAVCPSENSLPSLGLWGLWMDWGR